MGNGKSVFYERSAGTYRVVYRCWLHSYLYLLELREQKQHLSPLFSLHLFFQLFAPFSAALSVLPILGAIGNAAIFVAALIASLLCCFTVTTLAYIRYRPMIASAMLLLAGGIWGIVAWRLNIAATEGGTAAPTFAPTTSGILGG